MPKIIIPDEYICPISLSLIEDPVTIEGDESGRLYERREIERHFKTKDTIPHTNAKAISKNIVTNYYAKRKIKEFLEKASLCSEKEFLDAIKSGNVERVKALNYLEKYLDVQDPTEDQNKYSKKTPLHLAAEENNIEMLKFLLEEGADLKIKNSIHEFPLKSAARLGKLEAVQLMLEKTKDVESVDSGNSSAVANAAYNGFAEVVKFLISKGANIENLANSRTPLLWAAEKGRKAVVEILLEVKANINAKDSKGDTALHLAVKGKHVETVKLLLPLCGKLLETRNNEGDTPLMIAIKEKSMECIKILLDFKADCNVKNKEGNTPLLLAINHNDFLLIRLLLRHGADPLFKTEKGDTALIVALRNEKKEATKYLINKRSLSEKGEDGLTALHWAAKIGDEELVRLIISHKEDLNRKDNKGETPLHLAAREGHQAIVKILMEEGADYKATNHLNQTPSTLATINGKDKVGNFIPAFHKQLKSLAKQSPKEIEELKKIIQFQNKEIEQLKKQVNSLMESVQRTSSNSLIQTSSLAASRGNEPVGMYSPRHSTIPSSFFPPYNPQYSPRLVTSSPVKKETEKDNNSASSNFKNT